MNKTWNEVRSELFTPEEIAESDSRVALMGELIKAPDRSRLLKLVAFWLKRHKLHKS